MKASAPETSPVRWGVLGTGRISHLLVPAMKRAPRCDVHAIASRTHPAAAGFARTWGITQAFEGYDTLLEDEGVDAVYIGLPNGLHAEWTIRATRRGKHVLCEKPLCIALSQAEAILESAQRNGVVVAEALMFRHHPQMRKIAELLEGRSLGKVVGMDARFTFLPARPGDARFDPEMGGGCLWDAGCYLVSYARHFLRSEPVRVLGEIRLGPGGVDVHFRGELEFPGGTRATIECGYDEPLDWSVRIVCEGGVVEVPNPIRPGYGELIRLRTEGEVMDVEMPGRDVYVGEVEDFLTTVLDGQEPVVRLEDSFGNTRALVALHESARAARPVSLPHATPGSTR